MIRDMTVMEKVRERFEDATSLSKVLFQSRPLAFSLESVETNLTTWIQQNNNGNNEHQPRQFIKLGQQ